MLIDAHAHLDQYGDETLEAALAEITERRALTISVSSDVASYRRAQEIAARCDLVVPTFGIHPWNAPQWADRLDELGDTIAQSPMLGELGLDYYWIENPTTFAAQRRVLEHFLAAARDQNKIVNLHTKGAEHEILDLLRGRNVRRAIIHWYSGPFDALRDLIAQGAYFTVGVEILRSRRIWRIAQRIPTNRLLTETDNPGGWEWLTDGEIGMPGLLVDVIDKLAELRGVTPYDIRATVRANFLRLIGDDPRLAAVTALLAEE
jgi:TatD DNase family protein